MACKCGGRCLTQSIIATIPNGEALSWPVSLQNFTSGTLHMPAEWTAASIGFHVSDSLNGTYQPLLDGEGNRVELAVTAGNSYALPNGVMSASFVKLWSQSAGVDVNQADDRQIVLDVTDCSVEIVEGGNGGNGGAETFLALNDTPGNYTNDGGKVLAVNGAENGIEFVDSGVDDLELRVDDLENIVVSPSGTYFTSSVFVTFSGGLDLNVIWPLYYIDGVAYDAGQDTITLDAADDTHSRFDAVIVTPTGLDKITGVPGENPEQPFIDISQELLVTYVLVGANQTDLTINDVLVYDENVEFTVSSNNGTVDPENTTTPFSGTFNLDCGAFDSTHFIDFTSATPYQRTSFDQLFFFLYLKATFSNQTYLRLTFYSGAVAVSNTVNISNNTYNYSRTLTNTWQQIVVPLSEFVFSQNSFDRIRITFNGSSSGDGFKLDYFSLQSGISTVQTLPNFFATILDNDGNAIQASQPSDTLTVLGATKTGDKELTTADPNSLLPRHALQRSVAGNHTLEAGDAGYIIRITAAGVVTLPSGLDTNLQAIIRRATAGEVSLSADTLNVVGGGTKIPAEHDAVSVVHQGSGVWDVYGDLDV
jgi:hypothetical protein